MNASVTGHEVFEKMHQEHDNLREKLGRIHDFFRDTTLTPTEINTLLHDFEEALALHFSHEENDGFFDDVMKLSPESAREADRLCVEHRDLQNDAAELRRFANSGTPSVPWWRELASRCRTFSQRLMLHESAENRLLQVAYRREHGVVD
jgi:iron-sulfur cluster repair protein YtfE (RIC family)